MITRQRKRTNARRLWMPVIATIFLGYFGFHAFTGAFGIWAMDRLEQDASRLRGQLDTLQSERKTLEAREATQRPANLDIDAVDIEARKQLNMLRADEVILNSGAAQQPSAE
jgi:cell division protein FtsB